jgi:3-isopropylmalate/(R)-2-methylmalate dehydratase small subunit
MDTIKNFSGKVLFLDRADINTDEIIAAKYLMDGFDMNHDISGKNVIVSRANFGCGSSREHAPWALEANAINLVIAESFARIFRQNMFNCGMLAAELPAPTVDHLFQSYAHQETIVTTNLKKQVFIIEAGETREEIKFSLTDFDRALSFARQVVS